VERVWKERLRWVGYTCGTTVALVRRKGKA